MSLQTDSTSEDLPFTRIKQFIDKLSDWLGGGIENFLASLSIFFNFT